LSNELPTEEKIHSFLLKVISTHRLGESWDKVVLFVAERLSSFRAAHGDQWEEEFLEAISIGAIETPLIPVSLPSITIQTCQASNPGIQICDFLLWAVQRKVLGKDDTWFDRLKLKFSSSYSFPNDPLSGNSYFLRTSICGKPILAIERIPTADTVRSRMNAGERDKAMIDIEALMKTLYRSGYVIKNEKLTSRFSLLIPKLREPRVQFDDIVDLAMLFILIADEVPLYNSSNPQEIETTYFYKYICSLAANQRQITWFSMCRRWGDVRQWVYANQRALLFDS
jgi:hypothetical protein